MWRFYHISLLLCKVLQVYLKFYDTTEVSDNSLTLCNIQVESELIRTFDTTTDNYNYKTTMNCSNQTIHKYLCIILLYASRMHLLLRLTKICYHYNYTWAVPEIVSEMNKLQYKNVYLQIFNKSTSIPMHLCIWVNKLSKHIKIVSGGKSKNSLWSCSTSSSAVPIFRPRSIFLVWEIKKRRLLAQAEQRMGQYL